MPCVIVALVALLVCGSPALQAFDDPAPAATPLSRKPLNLQSIAGVPGSTTGWHASLVRNRRLEMRLRTAIRQIEAGDTLHALQTLQAVLDQSEDGFVQVDERGSPLGARRVAEELLRGLPNEAMRLYESVFGPEAFRLLDIAKKDRNVAGMSEVVRRFYFTRAGFEASNHWATHLMDHGALAGAVMHWQRLLFEEAHRARMDLPQRMKLAYCLFRLGRPGEASTILEPFERESIVLGDRRITVAEWRQQLAQVWSRFRSDDVFTVGTSWGASPTGSLPVLRYPVWTRSHADAIESSQRLVEAVKTWERSQVENALPAVTPQFPLVLKQQVVVRDFHGIVARDLQTGTTQWSFTTASSLSKSMGVRGDTTPAAVDISNIRMNLAGNHAFGMLASDGARVYAVDGLETRWNHATNPAFPGEQVFLLRQANQLLALDLRHIVDGTPKVAWRIGGLPAAPGDPELPLSRHFFIGPPRPFGGQLFVTSEQAGTLFVSSLKAETGEPIWTQEIAAVSVPIWNDSGRYFLGCTPSIDQGTLVCPTNTGLVVALDAVTGQLLWASSCDDEDQLARISAWPNGSRQVRGHPGFPNYPVIAEGSVVYLPYFADSLHCFDLATGAVRWKARRDDLESATAIESIAAVRDGLVVVVGRRRCRALSLTDGSERWSVSLPALPGGRGAILADRLTLPLQDGSLMLVRLQNGEASRQHLGETAVRPGNLTVTGDVIVAMNASELAVYPQAEALLTRLQKSPLEKTPSPQELLQMAELELAIGRTTVAHDRLRRLGKSGRNTDGADLETLLRARELLRESLFLALGESPFVGSRPETPRDTKAIILELTPLCDTPESRSRLTIARVSAAERARDFDTAFRIGLEFLRSRSVSLIQLDSDPGRGVHPDVWLRDTIQRCVRPMTDAEREGVTLVVKNGLEEALATTGVYELRRFAFVFDDFPEAALARIELIRRWRAMGEAQRAETIALASRTRGVAEQAAATLQLFTLYEERGLYHEAGRMLHELSQRYATVPLPLEPGDAAISSATVARTFRTGAEFVASLAERPALQSQQRFAPFAIAPGGGVRISETRWLDKSLEENYNPSGSQMLQAPRDFSFDLFDRGKGVVGQLALIDRHSGVVAEQSIEFSPRFFFPVSPQASFVGHLIPIGTQGSAQALSALDRNIAWSTTPSGFVAKTELVRVGPASPAACVFQCRQHLFAVHPATGDVLWHRKDLELSTGLMIDSMTGLFGDDQAIVVFSSDRKSYAVYRTGSGELVRRGKLDIDSRYPRRIVGRFLLHYTDQAATKQVVIWDPLREQPIWSVKFDDVANASGQGASPQRKVFEFVQHSDDVVYLSTTGDLVIVDGRSGAERVRLPTTSDVASSGVSYLRAFRSGSRYFVNLQRPVVPAPDSPASFIASDATLPLVHMLGDVCAIDAVKGTVLWHRALGNRSVLHAPQFNWPVLITLSRQRRGNQLALQVEVIDAATGEIHARQDGLLSDRLLQMSYDRHPELIRLRGARTEISIEFGRHHSFPPTDDPLAIKSLERPMRIHP